jgi:hypothetical protein
MPTGTLWLRRGWRFRSAALCAVLAAATGLAAQETTGPVEGGPAPRPAEYAAPVEGTAPETPPVTAPEPAPDVVYLDQGWSPELRNLFYHTPQGSRMIPYAWFMALDTADGSGRMADPQVLRRYGLIPTDGPSEINPDGLPIGFAIDPVNVPQRGVHLGLTCAACHTGEMTVEGQRIRIDGGAANFDFDSFYADLARAVERTAFNPVAFTRFAAQVVDDPSPTAVAELRLALLDFQAGMAGDATIRRPALDSGFGRVDALTQILNALSAVDQADPSNLRPVKAPTSYPHLWLAPQLEFVQWNPIAASPIGRNGGEVLGVFGSSVLNGPPEDLNRSTLLVNELHAMETWLHDLKPPFWEEEIFGEVNMDLAAQGEALYRAHCDACHTQQPHRMTPPEANYFGKSFIEIRKIDYRRVGTDPTYVEDLATRMVRTGPAARIAHEGKPLVPAAMFFISTVGGVVGRAMNDAGLTPEQQVVLSGFRLRPPQVPGGQPTPYLPESLTMLKAGPLDGIWASGPYLHNGSVPTIYELLSPVAERRAVFWTGGRELDRERLGFISDDAPGRFRFDTSLPGNRNIGHEYPPQGLTHDERMALVEYLKTL